VKKWLNSVENVGPKLIKFYFARWRNCSGLGADKLTYKANLSR